MKNILLASHYAETPGVVDKLALYFKKHNCSLFFILNPLFPSSSLQSILKLEKKEVKYKIFWPFQYFLEGLFAFIKFKTYFKEKNKFDLGLCIDPLSFLNVYIFKKFYQIDKLLYLNIDFSTQRFSNKLMNFAYLKINEFAYRKCDYFLYFTPKFIQYVDSDRYYIDKAFLIKHWIDTSSIKIQTKKKKNSIVFAGNLSYSVDFKPLLSALQKIKKEKIDFVFDIYGEGELRKRLQGQVVKLGLEKNIFFKGVIDNKTLIQEILPIYMIGVCPYITKRNVTHFDHMFQGVDLTSKLVEYIAAGLPIITTKLYDAFQIIEKKKIGFLVKSTDEWYLAIKKLLSNYNLYLEYQRNALKFAENYDEEKVLNPIFKKYSRKDKGRRSFNEL